jgi:hypothetical protein
MKSLISGMIFIIFFPFICFAQTGKWVLTSPDNQVSITVFTKEATAGNNTKLCYTVDFKGKTVINESPLGIDRQDQQFSSNLQLASKSPQKTIDEKYTLKIGKRLNMRNHAHEQTLTFRNSKGNKMELILRAYNDGVAFRYHFPDLSSEIYKVTGEETGFVLPLEGKAWLFPYDMNSRKKPSYEQYSRNDITIGSDSPNEAGWAYPMLFNTGGKWVMITEATMDGTYCGTHIRSNKDGLYKVHFAEKEEVILPDDPEPVSTLPWATPWRVIIVSDKLAGIVETNLVQNLNPACALTDVSWIRPGRSSWSWWSDGQSASDYKAQIEYVDFTAEMGWEYMLIDAGWYNMKDGDVENIVKYAKKKNVDIWLWYHSGAGRTTDTVNVMNLMSVPDVRKQEMQKLQLLGVKGIKVDFFDTDKQGIVRLFKDILTDAAAHHILVNFHGASLPRGLERTYPNLMTTEAVRGAESFGRQPACDAAPLHNTILPFTRNVVGSMDYTPVTFSNKIRQGVEAFNVTTYGHQLALSIIFESGVQNFADSEKSYRSLPDAPKNFLKKVPVAWDETRLVAGYPGDYVVMARRKGDIWYLGGINGKSESRQIEFDLPFIPAKKNIDLITDGKDRTTFGEKYTKTGSRIVIDLLPYGGFAGTIKL